MSAEDKPMGISGRIARKFLTTQITPLLALVGLMLGLFAVMITPREEEPQINVTIADVFIPFPGATAEEVAQLVATPAEQVLSEIEGIDDIFSTSQPNMAKITVQFKVGEDRTDALVRLYTQVFSNQDWLPQNLGVGEPLIKPMGIDDVPIVTVTLWTEDETRGGHDLAAVAHAIESELKRVPGTRDIYTVGGPDHVVHVRFRPEALAGYSLSVEELRNALQASNFSRDAGALFQDNQEVLVQAGDFITRAEDFAGLVVGMHDGRPVYLDDVAAVVQGPGYATQHVSYADGAAADREAHLGHMHPAVTVAIAKQPGTNAVDIANSLVDRLEQLRGTYIPDGIETTITRNYGATADQKAKTLIQKLIFATASVVVLVWIALGWREAFIVGTAVVITLAITLFASWAWGFTLNRVSLFALIFSIGILVDDAIVVVENIHRHMSMGKKKFLEAIPVAVDEVGGPTILATFTVIAALLPMAFVTGLMGPYMSPIPINASMGMIISLAVAYVVTPWLTYKVLRRQAELHERAIEAGHSEHSDEQASKKLARLFDVILRPFLGETRKAVLSRMVMLGGTVVLILGSVSLVYFQVVVLKMLPFDDKSEFQVVLDMPEGTSLEHTKQVLSEMGDYLRAVPEVRDVQVYAGTAAPINFNGLVRQYYLREGAHLGDIQVNLTDAKKRDRKSHDIALSVRPEINAIAEYHGGRVKVVEVPPGPPVLSPIVAEIYGPDYDGQIEIAHQVREVFKNTRNITDIDDSVEHPGPKRILRVDRERAARLGVSQQSVVSAVQTALAGEDVTFLYGTNVKYAVPVRLQFEEADMADLETVLGLHVRAQNGALVPISEVVEVVDTTREHAIHHKNLLPVVYVVGDQAGGVDSPLYGMFDLFFQLRDMPMAFGEPLTQLFIDQPDNPYRFSLKWDGEWQVTYETFRDMGIAYSVGLLLIYLLVVAQFRSYMVPLIIMAPIPLTVIGVMPGHAFMDAFFMDAKFTATSMIGMIALAGIIVRNSILLVDFVNEEIRRGVAVIDAVVNAGAVRAKPIVLTGLAAMVGAGFIIDDPIFSGLAISLIFGILVSTLLTLVIIPVLYYLYVRSRVELIKAQEA
ncbi:Acriflavin resistance protein [Thioalkalivibrio nitratireducens DSM 14787]|uniref:Acriflavin resistance protein n=1 Tax=Thioalkalivibrio nitratireducens (strain DSM 14787 / UNIQEM 213 / ALEN2) TaxID=1255043 RepID=L0E1E4_THIND|nr:efflux RND transporter permease subunit [Thioalkalivibrio nitratireducens]AGA35025.1 Acriflavin resistance protein [Thioalkalivibrio nitratireducens DSM 14787]